MKLNINNFAKINQAEVIVDGITVIAGENNTGKSTVGKILFSLFNALSDIESRILKERLHNIKLNNRRIIQNVISSLEVPRNRVMPITYTMEAQLERLLMVKLQEGEFPVLEDIQDVVLFIVKELQQQYLRDVEFSWNELGTQIYDNVKAIYEVSEKKLSKN